MELYRQFPLLVAFFDCNPSASRLLGKSVGSKLCPRLSSDKFFNSKYSRFFNAWSSTLYSLAMSSTSLAVVFSALPQSRIFPRSTATREWLTYIWDILKFRRTFFTKKRPKVLNRHTKWQRWQSEKLPVFGVFVSRKIFGCPSGKLSTEFTSPIAKSTSPGLSDTTFFARC